MLPKWEVYEEPGTQGRVRYDKGDVEFEVQWYARDISGGDERRIFKLWKSTEPNQTCTFALLPRSSLSLAPAP